MKKAETKAFAPLMVSETSRNLRRVFRLTELLKNQAPKGFKWRPSRVHVIGAGTMGADIAGVCVASGMEVTLQDISPDQLEKGIKAQGKLFARKFKTKATRDAAKARLIADPEGKGVVRADVIIEAIVERLDIKQKLFADLETKIKPGAVLATNTSSLKLEDIAAPLRDPGRLIGLHFFSPVPQMPLVEVVRGATTRDDEVNKGAAFVTSIDKFPLITKDVPGFLVNKVLTPYMFAAMKRLEEGEDKEKIDEAVRTFGMPMGPIELADNVGLDICAHVAKILGQSSEGSRLDRLVASGRLGKKTGEGFYVWKDGKPVKSDRKFSKAELEQLGRELVEPMIAEAQKTLDEGVVESADLVDAGMIFGTGFRAVPRRPAALQENASGNGNCVRATRRGGMIRFYFLPPTEAFDDTRTSARCGDRRRAHSVLPLEHALCRSLEPRDDDGGAERSRRSLRAQGRAHRRSRRRRGRHAFQGLQSGARGGAVLEARALDARRDADPGLRYIAAIGADVGGQDRYRRDRECDFRRFRYDVGRADRVLEEIFQASRPGRAAARRRSTRSRYSRGCRRWNSRRSRRASPSRARAFRWGSIAS